MVRLGFVAACGVLLVAALLLLRRERGDEGGAGALATSRVEIAEAASPPASAEFVAPEPTSWPAALPTSERVASADAPLRGTLRGRLVEAGSGAPLHAERVILLASPRNAVAETLRTRPDGSFASVRRFPRGLVRAWVSEPETRALLVRYEAEFEPNSPGEWLVPVPPSPASAMPLELAEGQVALHGMVVDLAGRPVAGAQVKLFPLASPGQVSCDSSTDAAGEFRLQDLARGPQRLLVQGRFASSAPHDVVLVEGRNEAGRILLPAAASVGALRGSLVAEEGGAHPIAVLLLRELASGKELAVTADWSLFSGENDGVASFAIETVPDGDYELAVVAVDGRVYEPALLRVSPPADGLEFRARAVPPRFFALRVHDASTGAELEDFTTLARIRGQWCGADIEGLPGGFDRWVVCREGYRPARGDFARAVRVLDPDADEEGWELYEVEVALERGHGLALLCKDIESDRLLAPEFDELFGPGVEGVTVLADGKAVAHSDSDGLALLDLPRAPDRLEFARPGWRVVGENRVEGVHFVHLARE